VYLIIELNPKLDIKILREKREKRKLYPAVNRVAIFLARLLAFSALSSERFLRTNPSPLQAEHTPEPPQSSQSLSSI
jgi:hypothetical protein